MRISKTFYRLVGRSSGYIAKNSKHINKVAGHLVKIPPGLNISKIVPKGNGLVNVLLKGGKWVVGVVFSKFLMALKGGIAMLKKLLGAAYEASAKALRNVSNRLRGIGVGKAAASAAERSDTLIKLEKAVNARYSTKALKAADAAQIDEIAKATGTLKDVSKRIKNADTLKDATKVADSIKQGSKGSKALTLRTATKYTLKVGKYALIGATLGVVVMRLAKRHAAAMTGCFRVAPDGVTRCKVAAYTAGDRLRVQRSIDPVCLSFEPPFSGDPWKAYVNRETINDGACLSVCNNEMLDLSMKVQAPLQNPSPREMTDNLTHDIGALTKLHQAEKVLTGKKDEDDIPNAAAVTPTPPPPPQQQQQEVGPGTESIPADTLDANAHVLNDEVDKWMDVKPEDNDNANAAPGSDESQVEKSDDEPLTPEDEAAYNKLHSIMHSSLPYYTCDVMSTMGALSDMASNSVDGVVQIAENVTSGIQSVVQILPDFIKYGAISLGVFALLAGGLKILSLVGTPSLNGPSIRRRGGGGEEHHLPPQKRRKYEDEYALMDQSPPPPYYPSYYDDAYYYYDHQQRDADAEAMKRMQDLYWRRY